MNILPPRSGTLWQVKTPGLVAATLEPVNKIEGNERWYILENITLLSREDTLLFLGDENINVSHWQLMDVEEYYKSGDYYKKHRAAVFLHNDKKIYVFYDDHYDIWEYKLYLTQVK